MKGSLSIQDVTLTYGKGEKSVLALDGISFEVTANRLYVVGSDIIAPDGTKFIPIGANVGADVVSWNPPTYAFTAQGYTASGHVADSRGDHAHIAGLRLEDRERQALIA